MSNVDELKELLTKQHEGDNRQLEVVFSENPRVIVEAPAGYGKTTTMISRIAYLLASGSIPNPKRILGLTFSINAALKVKREIAEKLPALINVSNNPSFVSEKATVTNYHGFCKIILKKYGYLLYDALRKDINLFKAFGDNEIIKNPNFKNLFSSSDIHKIKKIESQIITGQLPSEEEIQQYNELISKFLLPLDLVTHNAVILFTIDLFNRFPQVRSFYQQYFSLIIVDEFQDTNSIAWKLLKELISDNTKLLFLGDSLQRIYGFIGALPNIMSVATDEYHMTPITLDKNYRFRHNLEMLKLDANIRANAESVFNPNTDSIANLPAFWGKCQEDEAEQIVAKVHGLLQEGNNAKIAILCRGRGPNATAIESKLSVAGIEYFYGMFTDEDKDYIAFHSQCQKLFIDKFGKSKSINKNSLNSFVNDVKAAKLSGQDKTISSLIALLEALVEKVTRDYATISPEEKYSLLVDIFENHQLKQAMEYIDSQVIITTVHGAKGLEWEYVFLPDMERWVFPNYYTCINCSKRDYPPQKSRCILPSLINDNDEVKQSLLDELSIFYVGITRARNQVYVSASGSRYNKGGQTLPSAFSCMVSIKGINIINAQDSNSKNGS